MQLIPQVLKDLGSSEKAVVSILTVMVATALVFTGKITVQQWMDYTQVILGIYVAGKTVQGAASALGRGNTALEAQAERAGTAEAVAANDAAADQALRDRFERP